MQKKTREEYNKYLVEVVNALKKEGNFNWIEASEKVFEVYPEYRVSIEGFRSNYRYHANANNYKTDKIVEPTVEMFKSEGITNLRQQVLTLLKRKQEINNLALRLSIDLEELLVEIAKLELDGFTVDKWRENGKQFIKLDLNAKHRKDLNVLDLEVKDQIKFLVVSDTHFGHKKSEIGFFNQVIKDAYDKGVRKVFHVGDVTEGNYLGIRPLSLRELEAVGFDEQLELANTAIPTYEGLQYYALSGNHDETHVRNAYANIVKTLSMVRDDFTYLGHNFAKVNLTDNVSIALVHPTDGIGQNFALKLMQYVDRNKEDRLADFIFMGHYHKHNYTRYKDRNLWVVPSFMDQSEFMTDKNLASEIGALLITINLNEEGEVTTFLEEKYFLKKD